MNISLISKVKKWEYLNLTTHYHDYNWSIFVSQKLSILNGLKLAVLKKILYIFFLRKIKKKNDFFILTELANYASLEHVEGINSKEKQNNLFKINGVSRKLF